MTQAPVALIANLTVRKDEESACEWQVLEPGL